MARDFAQIRCSLWDSKKFRALGADDAARVLYFYLHTNALANNVGCYVFKLGCAIEDLGWSEEKITEAMDRLSKAYLVSFDTSERVLRLVGFFDAMPTTNHKHALGCLKTALSLPNCAEKLALLQEMSRDRFAGKLEGIAEAIDSLSEGYRYKIQHNTDTDTRHSPVSDDTAGPKYEFGKIFDEQFWPAYPSRGQAQNPKKPARLKFVAACNRGEDPLAIVAAVKAYAANPTTKVGTEFVKTAEVWLSKECWKDQAPAPKAIADVDVPKGWSEDDARWLVRLRKGASYWPQNVWGPRDINHPECRIPKHVYEHWVASKPVGPMVPATQQILRRA